MDYEISCKKVMDLDPKIRFAVLINEKGSLFAGGMREESNHLKLKKMMKCCIWN
ncbi:MAG: DUF6659 family protein [Nitrosotalea sp.]